MKLATEWDGFAAVPSEYVSQGDGGCSVRCSGSFKATGKHSGRRSCVWRSRRRLVIQHTDTAIVQAALLVESCVDGLRAAA
jgi:hypothetical protein